MTKIALTAAAILLATATAFAGSDHYGSENGNRPRSPVSLDHSLTASIRTQVNHDSPDSATGVFQSEPGQGIWGR
ncbi:DUF680 domain-containing protein [Mesorhizobium sp.]|uniref:DUF680 domain-containing protein n=1 Tax=Mesorhizobium sp. TaxID=1871066 RepID=UPI000FE422B6|nr:DUF680 domain-containing protein [Mesorhizobium sp.]RWA64049.1 MAG: DUF680 domain-containing protein [Mesorhizobium sp.]RWB95413.1 MAG: DUF680 domain-containing protein [Mesorhizobium sp.]RWG81093.1 MAG: DUF680 domain-containing protein [Mesorhizobium sp.]RWK15180.1 MAG: DUF680 domain-containing protein [Mesorhizobium sp.]